MASESSSSSFPRLTVAVALVISSLAGCGGGGGTQVGSNPPPGEKGVFTGFVGDFDWQSPQGESGGEGIGEGADGGGGFGVGGALGQFRNALVVVKFPDGTELGRALTDDVAGMVTVRPGRDYTGALLMEIRGRDGASYFEEGKNAYVPYEEGRVLRAIVPTVTRNVGITPFTEAGFRLAVQCQSGQGPATVCGQDAGGANGTLPSDGAITAANEHVKSILNQQFPFALQIDDVTRLPFIVGDATGEGAVSTTQRGRYGLVNIAFSKQAAMYNTGAQAPTLLATEQLSEDLLDGRLDGRSGDAPAVAAPLRTYDPHSIASELASALAQQTDRYGNTDARAALPSLVAFGNVRYDGYYFDARIGASGSTDTVAVATETASTRRTPGQVTEYVRPEGDTRGFMVYGNMGSGALFIKTDSIDSTSRTLALGNNPNGELGSGNTAATQTGPAQISLPGVLTHAVGGYGHTVTRFADGSVFAFGDNEYGQLGQGQGVGTLARSTTPLPVPLPAGAVAVAATNAASFALLEDGRVMSWGGSWGFGTLGDGANDTVRTSPAAVPIDRVVQIAARDNDVIALRADGTVWTWGSFSQTAATDPPYGVRPGHTVPTQLTGLPSNDVRKVLTEQGISIALMGDGAVYTWGIYFDITAQTFLKDLQPTRVLNLPPLRDVMPGGFNGYGQRPFDRLTAMGVDYAGRFWKIRGRVAERYDPADPTAQRRPQGQAPREDCASCHTVRPAQVPPPPVEGPACVLPAFKLDAAGAPVLVNSQSDCASCHNGNVLGTGFVLAPLTCVPPTLPPPRPPIEAEALTGRCELPIAHPPAPEGAFCATCHNGVIAPPLACSPDQTPVPPPSATTASITGAIDDQGPVNGPLGNGEATDDDTPTLEGTVSAALIAGETVRVLRNGTDVGAADVNGLRWRFTLPALGSDGNFSFAAEVQNAGGARGVRSQPFALTLTRSGPSITATIDAVADNVAPVTGNLGPDNATNDPTPTLLGRLSAPLRGNATVRVRRNGIVLGAAVVDGNSFSFSDTLDTPSAVDGTRYTYTATVTSGQGVEGVPSPAFAIVFDNQAPTAAADLSVIADRPVSTRFPNAFRNVPRNGGASDSTLEIVAQLANGSADERIEFLRNGQVIGSVALSGNSPNGRRASFVDDLGLNLSGAGAAIVPVRPSYTARVVDRAGNVGPTGAAFAVQVGFFGCEALRLERPDAANHFPGTDCRSCHAAGNPAPRTRLVMPAFSATVQLPASAYWCTFRSQETVPLPF